MRTEVVVLVDFPFAVRAEHLVRHGGKLFAFDILRSTRNSIQARLFIVLFEKRRVRPYEQVNRESENRRETYDEQYREDVDENVRGTVRNVLYDPDYRGEPDDEAIGDGHLECEVDRKIRADTVENVSDGRYDWSEKVVHNWQSLLYGAFFPFRDNLVVSGKEFFRDRKVLPNLGPGVVRIFFFSSKSRGE